MKPIFVQILCKLLTLCPPYGSVISIQRRCRKAPLEGKEKGKKIKMREKLMDIQRQNESEATGKGAAKKTRSWRDMAMR